MFVFIIPRTPVKYRNPLRVELWKLCYTSLSNQTSKKWKAIVVGDITEGEDDDEHFIYLKGIDIAKENKLKIAFDYIQKNKIPLNAEYLIRLDDDDIISPSFLKSIEDSKIKMDCYADKYHVCIDPIYLKISYRKKKWLPNTTIHKYEHAIKQCGLSETPLILQDHSKFWHIYYIDKLVFWATFKSPLYYRILTPSSITSKTHSDEMNALVKHADYLRGYGPWINIPPDFTYLKDVKKINSLLSENTYPSKSFFYWSYNYFKYLKNRLKFL